MGNQEGSFVSPGKGHSALQIDQVWGYRPGARFLNTGCLANGLAQLLRPVTGVPVLGVCMFWVDLMVCQQANCVFVCGTEHHVAMWSPMCFKGHTMISKARPFKGEIIGNNRSLCVPSCFLGCLQEKQPALSWSFVRNEPRGPAAVQENHTAVYVVQ